MNSQIIRLGKISILTEAGFVRYIKAGDHEVLRMIYFALRDHNWETAPFDVSDEKFEVKEHEFSLSYTATNIVNNVPVFRWHVAVRGNSGGALSFEVDGVAQTDFNRNRAGICVLHPILETINKPMLITHPDGTRSKGIFPERIEPHQPFLDIQKMEWEVSGNLWAELKFEGDIFETEDHRNWADTSFKTYGTPLYIPFPVMLHAGDKVKQKVKLSLKGLEHVHAPDPGSGLKVNIHHHAVPFPEIGTLYSGKQATSPTDLEVLQSLKFAYLRVEIDFRKQDWKKTLTGGIAQAAAMNTPVFLTAVLGAEPLKEWQALMNEVTTDDKSRISKVGLLPADRKAAIDQLFAELIMQVRKDLPDALMGCGFHTQFVDLNRNRFAYTPFDFVTYAVNPQVHAFDDKTVVENLGALKSTAASARAITGNKLVHCGPVSLRPRFNPDAKGELKTDPSQLPYHVDHRQSTDFAAAWMIGCVKYLAEGGSTSISLFEDHGMAGYFVADGDDVHPKFTNTSSLFPLYAALKAIRDFDPKEVIVSDSSDPLIANALVLIRPGSKLSVLANHTAHDQRIVLENVQHLLNPYQVLFIPGT